MSYDELTVSPRPSLRLVHSSPEQLQFDFDTPRSLRRLLRRDMGQWELDRDRLLPIIEAPAQHRAPAVRLARALGDSLGPYETLRLVVGCGFILNHEPHTVRFPLAALMPGDGDMRDGLITSAPLIAIEPMAWRDLRIDLGRRIEQYLESGTQVVWVVDGAQDAVHVFRAGRRGRALPRHAILQARQIIPDFWCPLSRIFIRRYDRAPDDACA